MNAQRQTVAMLAALVVATGAAPAFGQTVAPAVRAAAGTAQVSQSIPDFSGNWRHPSLPGYEPPVSGPGPVTNRSRRKSDGASNYDRLEGDYTNPILQPWAAAIVKRFSEISASGATYPSPANQCWPEPVPFIYKHFGMLMVQQPDKITMVYSEDHEVRWVRMNESHPAHVTPSWHGDSVGHWEGDTLVVDTVGVRTDRPFAMIDLYGTPYTKALHVIERFRLLDYEHAKAGLDQDRKENFQVQQDTIDRNYRGKHLQVHITVEDEGAFTMPWTATITYRPSVIDWPEIACAENTSEPAGKISDIPRADTPDF
jgi:hypothetical protein